MPNFDFVKKSIADKNSFRVSGVMGMFDLSSNEIVEHFVGHIDIDSIHWNVGVIYGASGTGKSSIAKKIFDDYFLNDVSYTHTSVVDDMPLHASLKTICQTFNTVGFSSPPSWLKPYSVLSNGEKMRVDLAAALLSQKEIIIFDEFTSVVNRDVAKVGSYAVQKIVRKNNKKFIAVSCHDDVIDWLEPDWTFCTDDMTFRTCKKKDQKYQSISISATDRYGKLLKNITI